jgi:hypothetical protein
MSVNKSQDLFQSPQRQTPQRRPRRNQLELYLGNILDFHRFHPGKGRNRQALVTGTPLSKAEPKISVTVAHPV